MTIQERINRNAQEQPSGCRVWETMNDKRGRPYIDVAGKSRIAYRALWIEVNGPIKEGLTVEHKCNNRSCLNLDHLELLPLMENIERAADHYRTTNPLFPCGHPRTGDILKYKSGVYKSGTQKYKIMCKPCTKKYQKEYHAATNRIHQES